jgi:preprotein translocase subunit Sss1
MGGAAYGILGSKLGFIATTVLLIIGSVGYVVYSLGILK